MAASMGCRRYLLTVLNGQDKTLLNTVINRKNLKLEVLTRVMLARVVLHPWTTLKVARNKLLHFSLRKKPLSSCPMRHLHLFLTPSQVKSLLAVLSTWMLNHLRVWNAATCAQPTKMKVQYSSRLQKSRLICYKRCKEMFWKLPLL